MNNIKYIEKREDETNWYINNILNAVMKFPCDITEREKIDMVYKAMLDNDKISNYIQNMKYNEFLKTPYWEIVSLEAKKRACFKCELCASTKNLNTHHRSYENHGYEHTIEGSRDLIVLCNECHVKFHFDLSDKNRNIIKKRNFQCRVVKSNDLIQNSRFQLSVLEQKIMIYLISQIKSSDTTFKLFNFKIVNFCNICGINKDTGNNYINLKKALISLSNKRWTTIHNKKNRLRWINNIKLNSSGTIKVQLHNDMKPYLLEIKKNFTQYELLYILGMQSQYSIRLYEILKSYAYKKNTVFDIEELKRTLIADNYIQFNDFKKRVLDPATKEINSLSDILITYEPIKQGRKYKEIKFAIEEKTDFDERLKTWKRIDEAINPGQISLFDSMTE